MPEPTKFPDKEKQNGKSALFSACLHRKYERNSKVSTVGIDIVRIE